MTPRDRRALALGSAVLLAAWLGLRGLPLLYADWNSTRDRIRARRLLLAETGRAIKALPRMEDSASVLTARVAALAPRILSGSTSAAALEDLSGRLGTLAGLGHGRVSRFEGVPDSLAAGPLRRVTASVELETDFRGVAELLDYLARARVVLVGERLQVTAAAGDAPPSVPEQLTVVLRLSAWYLARESGS